MHKVPADLYTFTLLCDMSTNIYLPRCYHFSVLGDGIVAEDDESDPDEDVCTSPKRKKS